MPLASSDLTRQALHILAVYCASQANYHYSRLIHTYLCPPPELTILRDPTKPIDAQVLCARQVDSYTNLRNIFTTIYMWDKATALDIALRYSWDTYLVAPQRCKNPRKGPLQDSEPVDVIGWWTA